MEDLKNEKNSSRKTNKLKYPIIGLALFMLGVLTLFGIRFTTYKSDDVHFHANFALYINGTKDDFKNFSFYKEVAACDVHNIDDVEARVHMHDNNPGLIHVHAHGVSWGAFFSNLGYTLGNKAVTTDAGTYIDGQDGNSLKFLLNGEKVSSIQNKLIKTEDVLLIDYGKDSDQVLKEHFKKIPTDAREANNSSDPAACGGNEDSGMMKRFKSALGLQTQ